MGGFELNVSVTGKRFQRVCVERGKLLLARLVGNDNEAPGLTVHRAGGRLRGKVDAIEEHLRLDGAFEVEVASDRARGGEHGVDAFQMNWLIHMPEYSSAFGSARLRACGCYALRMIASQSDLDTLLLEPNVADAVGELRWLALENCASVGLADWVQRQPIPVIAVGETEHCDVWVANTQSLDEVTRAIDRNPRASAALVQVLRAVECLTDQDALVVESMAYAMLQGGEEYGGWLTQARPRTPVSADAQVVSIERHGARLNVLLDDPGRRNAFSVVMRDGLTDVFKLVLMDEQISDVIVRGNGPVFSAGGDLAEFDIVDDPSRTHGIRQLRMPAQYLAQCADRVTFHLHGVCVGAGIELPAFAARVLAQPDTRFRLPEIGMGLIPGAGGCVSITRRVGRQRCAWLAITGQAIDAATALDWGLIDGLENEQ